MFVQPITADETSERRAAWTVMATQRETELNSIIAACAPHRGRMVLDHYAGRARKLLRILNRDRAVPTFHARYGVLGTWGENGLAREIASIETAVRFHVERAA